MDQIAFLMDGTVVYWSGVLVAAGAAVSVCLFLSFYLGEGGSPAAGFAAVPLSIALSLLLARLLHWYSRADSYGGLWDALTNPASGGYALAGAFAGCALAAWLVAAVAPHGNLPKLLDSMAVAGLGGIAVGRLAAFFGSSDRGQVIEGITFLPLVYPVTNAVSGATEYRFATFLFQAIVALVLLLVLLRMRRRKDRRGGDMCILMLMLYGASQIVLDSTRYDSLFFRSNGFVSIVQVLGALGLALGMICYSVWAVRRRGFRAWYVPVWLLMAASIAGAGYMEYYVQRRGNEALFAYSVMSACLAAGCGLALAVRAWSYGRKQ